MFHRNYINRKMPLKYTAEKLESAVLAVKCGMPYRKAAQLSGIPVGTIYNKVNNFHKGKYGRKPVLEKALEQQIVMVLNAFKRWKIPICKFELRILVKSYLDEAGINVNCFKDNKPGDGWVEAFIKRHNLSTQLSDKMKNARCKITEQQISDYYVHLSESLKDIPPQNIYNYNEICFSEDPGVKDVIVPRGFSRIERKTENSTLNYSVMFCANASGDLLPPMIVHKSEHLLEEWTKGGPEHSVYSVTESGWFNRNTFTEWFFEVFLKSVSLNSGPVAIIGENLASLFSHKIVAETEKKGIFFITLPKTKTHVCQPLDSGVFRPLKASFKNLLTEWRKLHVDGMLPKAEFPGLLKDSLFQINNQNQLAEAFRDAGVYPTNREEILKKVSSQERLGEENQSMELDTSHEFSVKEEPRETTEPTMIFDVTKNENGIENSCNFTQRISQDAVKISKDAEKMTLDTYVICSNVNRISKDAGQICSNAVRITKDVGIICTDGKTNSISAMKISNASERISKDAERISRDAERISKELERICKEAERIRNDAEKLSRDADNFTDDLEGKKVSFMEDEDWYCCKCFMKWEPVSDIRWIVCKNCHKTYHLNNECSGLTLSENDYYLMDQNEIDFQCCTPAV